MGQSHTQTNHSDTIGGAHESSIPIRETTRRGPQVSGTMFNKPQIEPPTPSEIEDWEYRPSRTGIAVETKVALGAVTLLMIAFGFIVWQKLAPSHRELSASSEEQLQPFVFGQTPEEQPDPVRTQHIPVVQDFQKPVNSDEQSGQPTLSEANPFLRSSGQPETDVQTAAAAKPNPFSQNAIESMPSPEAASPQGFFSEEVAQQQTASFRSENLKTTVETSRPLERTRSALPEPKPLELEPSLFFSSDDRTQSAEAVPAEMPEQEQVLDLFASVDSTQSKSVNTIAAPTQAEPEPFQPFGQIQTIASKEPEPQLAEPEPFQFEPTPASQSASEPAPSFEPLVLPEEPKTSPEPTKPVQSIPLSQFGEELEQPAPLSIQPAEESSPSFSPIPSPTPAFAPAQNPGVDINANDSIANERIYEVVDGDNYWTISRKNYGKARYFSALAEYNRHRIPRPERMKAGMKVLIPDETVLQQRYSKLVGIQVVDATSSETSNDAGGPGFFVDQNGQPHYRIGKGDTLTDIAQKHLGRTSRWVQIHGMNQDALKNANTLKIGTVLRLPRDASQVARAPE